MIAKIGDAAPIRAKAAIGNTFLNGYSLAFEKCIRKAAVHAISKEYRVLLQNGRGINHTGIPKIRSTEWHKKIRPEWGG